jgi:hypothetical protein
MLTEETRNMDRICQTLWAVTEIKVVGYNIGTGKLVTEIIQVIN